MKNKHQISSDTLLDDNCPRANVTTEILSYTGLKLATGRNHLDKRFAPCSCNTHCADTNNKGSTTCLAIHAEMDALLNLANSYYTLDIAYTIVVTRPPCLACLKVLLNTDIKVIRLTSKEYPDRDEVKAIWLKAGNIWETQS